MYGLTLSATDNLSGVASTSYSVDGGSVQTYAGAFQITGLTIDDESCEFAFVHHVLQTSVY